MNFGWKFLIGMMLKSLLFIALVARECLSHDAPTVVTNSGKIVGHYLTSYGGKKYEAYQGIPYALPPIEERRFKPPVPIQPWSGELMADRLRSSCCQYNRLSTDSFVQGNEDCLYLNVFVPTRKTNATMPVLFLIHGGGFYFGSNEKDEETFLMDYEVILVTVQYRLGLFGFLSTQNEVVPGNMGLKDQSLALKWVHENIVYFGGDPKKITLFGQSAGGASVHYQYLSPMSAGLFQNGISFSGTAFDSWTQTKNSRQKALELGELVNCTTGDFERMVKCLRGCTVEDLIVAQSKFMSWLSKPPVPFGPVVENSSKNSFIDRSPREIIDSGKAYDVPWITGVVSEEGLFPVSLWIDDDATLKQINDNWDQIAPFLLDYYDSIPKENHKKVAQKIRKQYFGDKPVNRETFMTLVHLMSNRWFFVGAESAATAQAKANESPVLFYYYSYRAVDSKSSELTNSSKVSGVCHGDDVYLFMKNNVVIPTKSTRDMDMQRVLINLLTTFASNGEPDVNVRWPKVNSENRLDYLKIAGPEVAKIQVGASDDFGQKKFWNSINFNESTG